MLSRSNSLFREEADAPLPHHAQQLLALGFKRFEQTNFYQSGDFTIEVVKDQLPRFWYNFGPVPAAQIASLTRVPGSPFLLQLNAVENGGLRPWRIGFGRMGGAAAPKLPLNPVDQPLRDQLIEAGFRPHPRSNLWLILEPESNRSLIALLNPDGTMRSLLTTIGGPALLEDNDFAFTSVRLVPRPHTYPDSSVLTIETPVLRFDVKPNGDLVADSQLPQIDLNELADVYLGVRAYTSRREPSGFVIGGRNETTVIQKLDALNGRPVHELEGVMRSNPASSSGFLGARDRLVDVLASDNHYVTEREGRTHQAIARHLKRLRALYWKQIVSNGQTFVYYGRRMKLEVRLSAHFQRSPFGDDAGAAQDFELTNLDNGETISASWLHADLIERYGFYEAPGTRFRLEPRKILRVLDFI